LSNEAPSADVLLESISELAMIVSGLSLELLRHKLLSLEYRSAIAANLGRLAVTLDGYGEGEPMQRGALLHSTALILRHERPQTPP
jgi:hypothetical protein